MRRKENVFTYLESVFLGAYGCQKHRKVPQVHRRLRQRLLHYAGCGTGPSHSEGLAIEEGKEGHVHATPGVTANLQGPVRLLSLSSARAFSYNFAPLRRCLPTGTTLTGSHTPLRLSPWMNPRSRKCAALWPRISKQLWPARKRKSKLLWKIPRCKGFFSIWTASE